MLIFRHKSFFYILMGNYNREIDFINETKTRKAVHLTMVSTYGIKPNIHSDRIQSEVTLEDLFA